MKLAVQLSDLSPVLHPESYAIIKTDYSEDELPLDPGFADVLLTWKRRLGAEREAKRDFNPIGGVDFVFPGISIGPYFHAAPAQQDYIRPAGCCLVACPTCGAGTGVGCLQDAKTPNGMRLPLHDDGGMMLESTAV